MQTTCEVKKKILHCRAVNEGRSEGKWRRGGGIGLEITNIWTVLGDCQKLQYPALAVSPENLPVHEKKQKKHWDN